jgi:hypothetical protein
MRCSEIPLAETGASAYDDTVLIGLRGERA